MIERMKTTYFGLLPTYLLLISFKITTFLLLISSNIGKVGELWTLPLRSYFPTLNTYNCVMRTFSWFRLQNRTENLIGWMYRRIIFVRYQHQYFHDFCWMDLNIRWNTYSVPQIFNKEKFDYRN